MTQGYLEQQLMDWDGVIKAHYDANPLIDILPDRAEERTWFVVPAGDKKNKQRVTARSPEQLVERIMDLKPYRILHSVTRTGDDKHFFETPFFFDNPKNAVTVVNRLVKEWGVKKSDISIIDDGKKTVPVTVQGPVFGDASQLDVKRFHHYFDPEHFRVPRGRAHTPNQQRFWTYYTELIEGWKDTNPAMLIEHLRSKTPLGNEAEFVVEFLHNTDNPAMKAEQFPSLDAYLIEETKRAVFPQPNLRKALEGARVPLVGSYDGFDDMVVRNLLGAKA